MFTTFSVIQQSKVRSLTSKNSGHKMENGYWQRWVLEITCNSSALSVPKISKAVAAQKNKLKIQRKRVLGCIKYTHRLADHNKVTQ
jgi:hypothetical protein